MTNPGIQQDVTEETWFVYGLIDPRNGWMFYVGITQNLDRRYTQHHCDRGSAAHDMCRYISSSGGQVGRCLFGMFSHKKMAEFLERQLITCIPLTYNRTFFEDGLRLWEPLAIEYGYRCQAEKVKKDGL